MTSPLTNCSATSERKRKNKLRLCLFRTPGFSALWFYHTGCACDQDQPQSAPEARCLPHQMPYSALQSSVPATAVCTMVASVLLIVGPVCCTLYRKGLWALRLNVKGHSSQWLYLLSCFGLYQRCIGKTHHDGHEFNMLGWRVLLWWIGLPPRSAATTFNQS